MHSNVIFYFTQKLQQTERYKNEISASAVNKHEMGWSDLL